MSERKRPLAVTIISWYLIISAAITAISLPFVFMSSEALRIYEQLNVSHTTITITALVGSVVCCIAGLAMIRRKSWGRLLWYFYAVSSTAYTFYLYGNRYLLTNLLPVLLLGVTVYFLTRRKVNAYFAGEEWRTPEDSRPRVAVATAERPQHAMWMKVVGVILLVFGGVFLYMVMIFAATIPLDDPVKGAASLGIFAGLCAAFTLPGMFLWGIWRWKILSGILLVCCGGIMLLISLVMLQAENLTGGNAKADPVLMAMMGKRAAIEGLPATVLGIFLIVRQRKIDKGI